MRAHRVEQKRAKDAAEPIVRGDVETFFSSREDGLGELIAHELLENVLQAETVHLEVSGQRSGELNDSVVEEGRPDFERVRHAHAVALVEDVVGQIEQLVQPEVAVDEADLGGLGREAQGQGVGGGPVAIPAQGALLFGREGAVPEKMGGVGGEQRAAEEALELVLEADLVVGHRPQVKGGERGAAEGRGNGAQGAGQAVREIGVVAAQQLVGAFAAQRHRDVLAAHAGEEPDGQGAGVGAGLVGIVGQLFDGGDHLHVGIEVELAVVGGVLFGHHAEVAALIETTALEGDGEGFQLRGGGLGGVVQDGGGVDAAAGPHTQGDVGDEVLAHGVAEQAIELVLGGLESEIVARLEFQAPISVCAYFPFAPLEPLAGRKLLDAFDQRIGAGNVVEREVVIEALEIQAPLDFGMLEDGLELGAEIEVAAAAAKVERLDAHAVAGEQQAFLGGLPEGQREHAAEALEAGGVPLQQAAEDHFGVATGVETMAQRFKLPAQLGVIVDFAVEDQHGGAIVGGHGLLSAGEIDNLQADGAEGDIGRVIDVLLVGAAMNQGHGGAADAFGIDGAREVCESSYATHVTRTSAPRQARCGWRCGRDRWWPGN